MSYPKQFGFPCWEKKQADKCINYVAQVTPEQAPLFLATHSPIKNIKDAKADKLVTEEEAFLGMFSRTGEIRGVVRGDVGTGKSHLIRWINLRTEYAASIKEFELNNFKIVMVQRETGSLKSALKQIVEQLGGEFEQYIEDIKTSIDKFSDKTARETLIQELALEINEKWEQRGHAKLPKRLKALGDVLLSPGYRRWLGRDDGLVDEIIARWTESSTREEREKDIIFTIAELNPKLGYLNRNEDAPQVHAFVEDIEFEDDTAEDAVEVLNKALIDAKRELSGIKGAKLNEIFTAIRRKLFEQGKQLAVFIEDATAASGGLDLDLFQSFEQKQGKNLCRMIALLGMSNQGWNVLPDNEKDRVDFEFDIGENAIQWANDQLEVAKFAARYLNAIRCNDEEINNLAKDRFSSDVANSKCNDCPHNEQCHNSFGYVQIESDVKIGLFPFSMEAPQKFLKFLNQERHRKAPRGLLDLVLNVTMTQSYDNFGRNTFPDPVNFGVIRPALIYWTEFEAKYLGGTAWSNLNRNRTKFLAEFWINANSPDEAANLLEPYHKPFSLPDFSDKPGEKIPDPIPPTDPPPQPPGEDPELQILLANLDEWSRGKKLASDSKFRDFLSKMLSKSMRWQDHRGVPVKFAIDMTRGTRPIRIEDQKSKVMGQLFFLDFFRNNDTRQLLESLVRYEYEGNGSWNFETGELHKRRAYRWIRRNQKNIIESLNPKPSELTQDAVRAASQLLALTAILRLRSPLRKKLNHEIISEIFITIWGYENRPNVLSEKLNRFVQDIETKWEGAKELLINELGVGQGESAPKDFIDPLPILKALDKFENILNIQVLPEEINQNFWKVRFGPVTKLSPYADFDKALEEENKEIKDHLTVLINFLYECGYRNVDLKKEIKDCVNEIVEVIKVQKKNMGYPNRRFEILWESKHLQENPKVWGHILEQAAIVTANSSKIEVLCFDPLFLKQAWNDLAIVTMDHLEKIEKHLKDRENPGGKAQEGTKEKLLNELKQIFDALDEE